MEYRYIKTGAFAGKTINLGGYQFVDGVYVLGPNADGVAPSAQSAASLHDYLGKCYQAYMEGSPELAAAQAGEPTQEGPAQHGEQDPNKARIALVRDALVKLDPENDAHWTGGGLPSVEAVRELAESSELSRSDITEAAPKLNRDEARKARAEDPLND